MIEIPLKNIRGAVVGTALIDDQDAALAAFRWHMTKRRRVQYARRSIPGVLEIRSFTYTAP